MTLVLVLAFAVSVMLLLCIAPLHSPTEHCFSHQPHHHPWVGIIVVAEKKIPKFSWAVEMEQVLTHVTHAHGVWRLLEIPDLRFSHSVVSLVQMSSTSDL